MSDDAVTRVRMTPESPDPGRTKGVFDTLLRAPRVGVYILQACFTPEAAWVDVELRGPEGTVRDTQLRTREQGVIVSGGVA